MNLESFILSFFDFVGNINFNVFGILLFVFLMIFWFVLVGWVWVDSAERTSSKNARIVYLLLVIFLNIPGLIIYLIIRPNETIEQIYWADLERRYLKYETSELGDCPECGSQLFPGYLFCSNCGCDIKRKCSGCGVMISKSAQFCPYCSKKVIDNIHEEEYPSPEIMQQQILASKEEAIESVESNRLRYKQGGSFVVKLGDTIILGWKNFWSSFDKEAKQEVEEKESKQESTINKKKKKKKGKKRK